MHTYRKCRYEALTHSHPYTHVMCEYIMALELHHNIPTIIIWATNNTTSTWPVIRRSLSAAQYILTQIVRFFGIVFLSATHRERARNKNIKSQARAYRATITHLQQSVTLHFSAQLISYSSNASRLFQCSARVSYYRNRTKIYWPWWVYMYRLSAIKRFNAITQTRNRHNCALQFHFLVCIIADGKEELILLIPLENGFQPLFWQQSNYYVIKTVTVGWNRLLAFTSCY